MKTLKYWYITGFRKGEWKGCMAHGIVHGHQRLADGILIHWNRSWASAPCGRDTDPHICNIRSNG